MKRFVLAIIASFAMLVSCAETQGAAVMSSRIHENSIKEVDGVVTISIFIDKRLEPKVKELEGTAMLRTNRLLRRQFKGLPRNFSLPVSVECADYDAIDEVYTYVTKIRRCDIEECIKIHKEQLKQCIVAKKMEAEKGIKEERKENATETKAVEQKAAGTGNDVATQVQSKNAETGHIRIIQAASLKDGEVARDGSACLLEEAKRTLHSESESVTTEEAKLRNESKDKSAEEAVLDLFK